MLSELVLAEALLSEAVLSEPVLSEPVLSDPEDFSEPDEEPESLGTVLLDASRLSLR